MISAQSVHYKFVFIGAIAAHGLYPSAPFPVYFIDVNCDGNENSIQECPGNSLDENYECNLNHTASVRCQGELIIIHYIIFTNKQVRYHKNCFSILYIYFSIDY